MLARLFRREDEARDAPFVVSGADFWAVIAAHKDSIEALTNDAAWACVDVLASSVAGLPVDAVRQVGMARIPVTPQPSLLTAPSALVSADVWKYQLMWSMLYDGNGFGKVMAVDALQRPTIIELVDAAGVTERKVVDGVAQAKVNGKVERLYPHGDLWHVPGKMVRPGSPFALSPVEYAKKAIAAGLAAQDFGLQFFNDGGHPSSLIYSDQVLDEAQARLIKTAFKNATMGNRDPAVFGSGLKYEQISVDPNDSQFIELQRLTTEKVCRFFRVPPAMVYATTGGQNVTYQNVSQADLHYLKHSLDGYLVRIENALTELLPRPQVVKFNRNALLRADAEGRNKVYDIRLRNKTMSVNEVRSLEDEAPIDDPAFDEPGIPGGPDDNNKPAPQEGNK